MHQFYGDEVSTDGLLGFSKALLLILLASEDLSLRCCHPVSTTFDKLGYDEELFYYHTVLSGRRSHVSDVPELHVTWLFDYLLICCKTDLSTFPEIPELQFEL